MDVVVTEFDSRRAAIVSGLTRAMVDYLARTGVVKPTVRRRPGKGNRRLYSFGDLVTLRATKVLLEAGVSVARLKRAMAALQKAYGRDLGACPADLIFTDGRSVFLRSASDAITDLTAGNQLVFAFMCDLRLLHRETLRAVQRASAA